jgi:N-acetylglucosamine malate deacetylase 1
MFYQDDHQKVLCIVAHPDDETLGVGGTLALHAAAGSEVTVLILSEAETEKLASTPHCPNRRECALRAAKALGLSEVLFEDFPGQRLDALPFIQVIKAVEHTIERFRPTVIYTHHRGDANTDHQVVFKATYAACRPMTPLVRLCNAF